MQDRSCFNKVTTSAARLNIAARIAAYARMGEVLVSQDVVEASDAVGVTFSEIGPVQLEGVSEPLRLHIARRDQ